MLAYGLADGGPVAPWPRTPRLRFRVIRDQDVRGRGFAPVPFCALHAYSQEYPSCAKPSSRYSGSSGVLMRYSAVRSVQRSRAWANASSHSSPE